MSALKDAQHAKTPSLALPALLITTFFGITLAAPPKFKTVPFPSQPNQLTYYKRFLRLESGTTNVLSVNLATLSILIDKNAKPALRCLEMTAKNVSMTL